MSAYSVTVVAGPITVTPLAAVPIGTPGVGVPAGGTVGQVLKKDSGVDYDTIWADETGGGGGGVTDHGALTGLADDDHTQYHNNTRGDARYWQLTTDLATQAELNAAIAQADIDWTADIAAEAVLARNATNLSSGTVADARIASTIARDSEVTAAVAAEAVLRTAADDLLIPLTQKGAVNGVVPLDAGGKIASTYLPSLSISEVFTVASQVAMLALTAERGDIALRTDLNPDGFFILTTDSPSTLADWVQITAPGAVTSVSGLTGTVDLSTVYQPLDGDLTALAAAGNSTVLSNTTASFLIADETKLDGIETAATADQTAAEILAKMLTVDGTGSGLDADLLDGIDSSAFVRDTGDETIAGVKTFSSAPLVPELAYDATSWNGSLATPTRNALRDKFESLDVIAAGTRTTPDTGTPGEVSIDVLLSGGISGGDTLTGGTGSGEDLTLVSTAHATRGTIFFRDQVELLSEDKAHALTTPYTGVLMDGTFTLSDTSAFTPGNVLETILLTPTIVYEENGASFFASSGFRSSPTILNASTEVRTAAAYYGVISAPIIRGQGAGGSLTLSAVSSYRDYVIVGRVGGAGPTATVTLVASVTSDLSIEAGGTVTTRKGLSFSDAANSGTLGTQIGVDIAALTAGTTDIGIRIAKADTYTLQLSSTAGDAASGITFGTDTTLYRSAANTLKTDDSIIAALGILSLGATDGLGYGTGAGGTVTQATSKSTGVTLNKATGQITMNGAALAAATTVSFTLTNSAIAANDILVLNHRSAGTAGSYTLNAQCAAGSATINVRNVSAGSLSEAIVISFAVMKAAAS